MRGRAWACVRGRQRACGHHAQQPVHVLLEDGAEDAPREGGRALALLDLERHRRRGRLRPVARLATGLPAGRALGLRLVDQVGLLVAEELLEEELLQPARVGGCRRGLGPGAVEAATKCVQAAILGTLRAGGRHAARQARYAAGRLRGRRAARQAGYAAGRLRGALAQAMQCTGLSGWLRMVQMG